MTTLILERHAESTANLQHMFAGHSDHNLSPRGHQQAQLAADYIAAHLPVDVIYSSDLPRAMQTAQPVATRLGLEIIPDSQLREIRADFWSYKPYEEIIQNYPEAYTVWNKDIGNARCPGGESTRELSIRIMAALTRIAEAHPGETVLVTTHATPIRVAQCLMSGHSLTDMKDIPWVSNASLTTAVYDNGTWQLLQVSRDDYLDELRTALPADA